MNPYTTELGELVAAMATDAVNIQMLWDLEYQNAVVRFQALVEHADPTTVGLLRPLMPARMLVRNFELSFQAMLTTEQVEAFTIQALPINLEFTLRHAVRVERHSRIGFSVEQVPLATATRKA
ncbi:MAG TPA: hypothetical protein VF297_02375 [Pyrinomonadaceae bacterium]